MVWPWTLFLSERREQRAGLYRLQQLASGQQKVENRVRTNVQIARRRADANAVRDAGNARFGGVGRARSAQRRGSGR